MSKSHLRCAERGLSTAEGDMWAVVEADFELHVIPIGDTAQHELSGECWCHPVWDDCWAHRSADGRERRELQ